MSGWTTHTGTAVSLPLDTVDTDQLLPARFMSQPREAGYGNFLLHDVRRDADGNPNPSFPLNAQPGARVMVAGRVFGSGSSREAAVYALVDAGFIAVVATSFGDIFAANAVNNGLLPARVSATDLDTLHDAVGSPHAACTVDLATRSVTVGTAQVHFELDDTWCTKLQQGWDDIDLTLQHRDALAAFAARHRIAEPWAWPRTMNND